MQKFTDYLKKIFGLTGDKAGGEKKPLAKKMNVLLLLASAGVLMILLSNFFTTAAPGSSTETGKQPSGSESEKGSGNAANAQKDISEMEKDISQQLEKVLGQISGVGTVEVTVNLASTPEKDFAVNTTTGNKNTQEQDQGGGTRAITETSAQDQMVLVRESQNNQEQPVVVMEKKPEVKGVVVVADGVNDAVVKANVMNATQVYLDIPLHKVIVLPRESR